MDLIGAPKSSAVRFWRLLSAARELDPTHSDASVPNRTFFLPGSTDVRRLRRKDPCHPDSLRNPVSNRCARKPKAGSRHCMRMIRKRSTGWRKFVPASKHRPCGALRSSCNRNALDRPRCRCRRDRAPVQRHSAGPCQLSGTAGDGRHDRPVQPRYPWTVFRGSRRSPHRIVRSG